jgi:hypothetical protein
VPVAIHLRWPFRPRTFRVTGRIPDTAASSVGSEEEMLGALVGTNGHCLHSRQATAPSIVLVTMRRGLREGGAVHGFSSALRTGHPLGGRVEDGRIRVAVGGDGEGGI